MLPTGTRIGDQRGQAAVSFVATVPLLAVAALLLLQLGLIGYSALSAANAARAAARAAHVGTDPETAARAALPEGALGSPSRPRVRLDAGLASVRIEAPRLAPLRPLLPRLRVGASAALVREADGGG